MSRPAIRIRSGRVAVALVVLAAAAVDAGDWPHWRGPGGLGVSDEVGVPVSWDPTDPGSWRVPMVGIATSTPVVVGDRLFVTSQIGEAPLQEEPGDPAIGGDERLVFVVQGLSVADGRELWRWDLQSEGPLQPVHIKHNLATPSPASDGESLFVWFGTGQVASLSLAGEPRWQRHLGRELGEFEILWAHGSSPVVHGDLVLLLCDHDDRSYLLALDKATGETRWRADRGAGKRSYATPLVVPAGQREVVVVNSNDRIDVYDLADGRDLWHVGGPVRVPVASPVWAGDTLYASRGYRSGPYFAVRLGGSGDVTASHLRWRVPTGAPYVSSLLHHDGLIYMATENGVVSAVDAADGSTVWRRRLGGNFSASPVVADGKVYLLNESGELFVIRTGRSYELVARSDFEERTLASPAVAAGRVFIRSDRHLYALGGAS
ncbi:MAG: PQQ-binding-like beta-propeller repeat protein [Thermoanaerobaculia bacterium]|nr:PQQ-binding-like beta-propeller repeat protein [Thermoanaerobaculia bacterium]